MSYEMVFDVEKGDFEKAGEASRKIKRSLQQLGISSKVIRHIAIAGYEDVGPGIPNVDLAMTEGWSTASDKVREMGFGAGMGLPNMEKNADDFEIHSKVGEGTKIKMYFKL